MLERASRYWIEFGNSTGLYNFSFLFKSKNKFEQIFWLIASIVGTWFTISDVKNSIDTYMSFPTATRLQVLENDTMELKDLTLCFDFDISRMVPEIIPNATTITDFLMEVGDVNLLEILSVEPNFEPKTEENQLVRMGLSLILGVLTSIVRSEQLISSNAEIHQWGFPLQLKESSNERYSNLTSRETLKLVNQWMETRYNFTQLVQYAGRFLCRMVKLKIRTNSFRNDNWIWSFADPCELGSMLWLGSPPENFVQTEIFCSKLNSEYFKYHHPVESTIISAFANDIHIDQTSFNYARFVYLSFHDPFLSVDTPNLLYIPRESLMFYTVTVVGDYSELGSPKRPCGNGRIQPCLMRCRSKDILEKCRCQPLSYPIELGADLPTCGNSSLNDGNFILPRNPECRQIQSRFKSNENCTKNCLPPCRYLIYGVTSSWDQTLKEEVQLKAYKNVTVIEFSFDVFKYPMIEEIPLMTAKDLFTSLGGNLSLYLGASFIVLLHFATFFTNVVSNEIRLRLMKV